MKKLSVSIFGLMIAFGGGIAHAETITSVTQVSYDAVGRPKCTVTRMNPAIYATGLPTDACALGTEGAYGPDRIIRNTYDAAGQLLSVEQAVGVALNPAVPNVTGRFYARYTYSLNGQKTSEKDANGNLTTLEYDGFDRLIKLRYPNTTLGAGTSSTTDYEAFTYDPNGNLKSQRKRNGVVISYDYDALNRQTKKYVTNWNNLPVTLKDIYTSYDLVGHITAKRFDSLTGLGVTYAYDGLGRVTSSTDMSNRTVSYLYNQASARTRLTYPDATYITYSLDNLNRLTNITHSAAGSLSSMGYNNRGQRTYVTKAGGGTTFGYDVYGRLTTMTDDLSSTPNDITWTFAYTPSNQIKSWSASSVKYDYKEMAASTEAKTYDGLNRDTSIAALSGGYDASGNMTNDGVRKLTYDAENRLLTVTLNNTVVVSLSYDPEGRLYTNASGGLTKTFLYDGTNLIGEYNGATVLRRYVHGTGVDEPLVWFEGPAFATKRYFVQNYQGSVIGYTDSAGALQEIYKYSPYGEPKNATNDKSWSGSPFRYTGQTVLSDVAGVELYYYKARVYDPAMGRFLQTDPIGSKDDLDLYAYVGGDPINKSDPSGLCGSTSGDKQSQQDQCTGSWSEPTQEASGGQDGTARWGERWIQEHYSSDIGGEYVVDPKTMKMGTAIDIGSQIQDSIDGHGYMANIYKQALETGQETSFTYGPKKFSPALLGEEGPAGRSVGRFAGVTTGVLSVAKNGDWSVTGMITINPDTYNWKLDAGVPGFIGAITPNSHNAYRPNFYGSDMTLVYNRTYSFTAFGNGPH